MRGCVFSIVGSLLLVLTCAVPLRADDVPGVADRLAHQHLAYIYGSEDVHKGGLDCSGFVQIVFKEACGLELPNEADKQLEYCRQHGQVWDAHSGWTPATLQPGDLIFFAGPDPRPRESMVTHVMIYCGHDTMAGAQCKGKQQNGQLGGVGDYFFPPHYPNGVLGESGERFLGHRRVFAYARLGAAPKTPEREIVAAVQVPVKTPRSAAMGVTKPFGNSSRTE